MCVCVCVCMQCRCRTCTHTHTNTHAHMPNPVFQLEEEHGGAGTMISVKKGHSCPTYERCLPHLVAPHKVRLHVQLLEDQGAGDSCAVDQPWAFEVFIQPIIVVAVKVGQKVRLHTLALVLEACRAGVRGSLGLGFTA